jgi:hypothetical protein
VTPEFEAGDWIVYTRKERGFADALGGPWSYGKLTRKGVDGWTVWIPNGTTPFIMTREIVRVTLSQGEALDLVDKLTTAQRLYQVERAALKPKFQAQIDALLNTKR